MSRRSSRVVSALGLLSCLSAWTCATGRVATDPPIDRNNGNLTRSIDQMSAGDLWDAGTALSYVKGPSQDRQCASGACQGRINAVANQRPGPGNVVANGTIVGQFVNRGKVRFLWPDENMGAEERYRSEKSGGDKRYYLIARSDGANGWTWTVREAVRGSTALARETVPAGSWTTCTRDSTNPNHPQGKSEFARCPHPTMNGQAQALMYNPLDPGWLDCEQGCCTAGQ